MAEEITNESRGDLMIFETLNVNKEGSVLMAEIATPPMNLLGSKLVRELVSLFKRPRPTTPNESQNPTLNV